MRRPLVSGIAVPLVVAFGLSAGPSLAATPSITAPAGGGQPALSVGFDGDGKLRATACAAGPCGLEAGTAFELPTEIKGRVGQATLTVVPLGRGRSAVWVRIPAADPERAWEAILAADPTSKATKTIFADWTGWVSGEYGLRRGPMVHVAPVDAAGSKRIVLGEQREDVTLCRRPTVLAPQLLTPDLELRPAKVQRLSPEERAAARQIRAERVVEPPQSSGEPAAGLATPATSGAAVPLSGAPGAAASPRVGGPALLRAIAASSAVGLPGALTDGDPNTTWAENRGGAGRGEFVVMTASSNLPLQAFDVTVRPAGVAPSSGVAPREFWLATEREVWRVTMPEDAWSHPGARYRIALDKAVQSGCLALVTESAWVESKDAQVTFAELAGVSEFDVASIPSLVGALAGGGDRAQAAAAVLSASGEVGHREVAARFSTLDEQGRRAALDVLDGASCEVSASAYVQAFLGPYAAQRLRAKERLERCGEAAAAAIESALGPKPTRRDPLLLAELAVASPGRAVPAIVARLRGDVARRRLLRTALSVAARSESGHKAIEAVLAGNPEPNTALEILRALGPSLRDMRVTAEAQLMRLAQDRSFPVRYLVLEPAAELAEAGSAPAASILAQALAKDQSPYVRTRAAELASDPASYQQGLLTALRDPEVRVREAALHALRRGVASFARPLVLERLRDDPWPIVRVAAADAAAELPEDSNLDQLLAETLDDDAATVRASAIRALGVRRARRFAPEVLDVLEDRKEDPKVRLAAARALGKFCYEDSADALTKAALRLTDPLSEPADRELAWASVEALSRIAPSDLRERLAPLLGSEAPARVRHVASSQISRSGQCRSKSSVGVK